MALTIHRPTSESRRPRYDDTKAATWSLITDVPSTVGCFDLIDTMAERSLAECAATIAEALLEAVPAGTEHSLPTGARYCFGGMSPVAEPVLTRDGTPLNRAGMPFGPSYETVSLAGPHRVDLLAFFAELPVLVEALEAAGVR